MANRYDQLLTLIDQHKPRSIIEVGVHRGVRAAAMCGQALKGSWPVHYTGYDVFDTKDKAFQEAAMNGKGIATRDQAAARLNRVKALHRGRLSWGFAIGDTRETLHGIPLRVDFAFIDGDHRVECIRKDYEALSECPLVVFDDYYCPDERGHTVDLVRYGANAVVAEIEHYGKRVEILPVADPCKHGGVIRLAVVRP